MSLGTEMGLVRMLSSRMILMWYMFDPPVPCWSLIEEMLLFGKSLLTRRTVIISLIQFPVQVYILIFLFIIRTL